jgi:cytoskeletal protein CcmA (bactofilin family)
MFSRTQQTRAARPARANAGAGGLSFIGPEMTIGGDATTTGPLHVEGRIDGHVRCATLIQGESGTIAGDITADEARIAGLVEGTVDARTIIVEATGRVAGDVAYETISIAAGARIEGRLARREALALGADAPMLIATPAPAAGGAAKDDAKAAPSDGIDDMFPTANRKRATA